MDQQKKSNFLVNPLVLSGVISGMISTVIDALSKTQNWVNSYHNILNVFIPPFSIMLSLLIAYITSRFSSYTFEERLAISKLNARKNNIKKMLDEEKEMSEKTKNTLKAELNEIYITISTIGKSNIHIDLNKE